MKKIKHIILLALTAVLLYSCEDNSASEPVNIDYITLDSYTDNLTVLEGESLNKKFKIFTSKKMKSDTRIDIKVNTSMDSENYYVPTSVVIPANSNEATINVDLYDLSLNRMGETMTIELNSLDNYFVGYGKVDLNISVLCPSDLAGTWKYNTGKKKTITITENEAGKYRINADDAFKGNFWIDITDSCGNINIVGSQIESDFGYSTSGSGTVSTDKQTITLKYTVNTFFTNRKMILKKI